MFRFFVNEKTDTGFLLGKDVLNHIKVARISEKEFICIYEEEFYICKLIGNEAKIIKKIKEDHEFSKKVILAASIIDTKRFEWLIQKSTELGATKIIPMYSENVSKKIPGDINKKIERWNKIAHNASEQSFRNKKLIVEAPLKFEEVLKLQANNKYIAHEKSESLNVIESFNQDVLFLVGPEGGFSEKEVNQAEKNGFNIISLGKRILRAETASIFLLSRVNHN